MLLRYSSRPLAALGVGYILVAGAPAVRLSTAEVNLPAGIAPPLREVSRRTITAIFSGLALIGFSLLSLAPAYRTLGAALAFIAGGIALGGGVGQMLGFWEWAEYREQQEDKEDKARLERVMGAVDAPLSAQGAIANVAHGNTETASVETKFGPLVTTRTPDGFRIQLGDGEKSRRVELVRVEREVLVPSEWANTSASLIQNGGEGQRWEALLDLYR